MKLFPVSLALFFDSTFAVLREALGHHFGRLVLCRNEIGITLALVQIMRHPNVQRAQGFPRALWLVCLAERWAVKQAAVCPLSVQATGQTDWSGFADVCLKDFTVVALSFDGALERICVHT